MEASRHLRSVPLPESGELPQDGPQTLGEALLIIDEQNRKLNAAWAENAKLKRQLSEAQAVEPEAETILEVLEHWRRLCMPGASIVVGSERWLKVRARLREKDITTKRPAHTPLKLKAAVAGALLSDWHVTNRRLDATTIFRDAKTVDDHVARAVGFKARTGISALSLIDELAGGALDWLADRCSCGGFFIEHLRAASRDDTTAGRVAQEFGKSGMLMLPCPERDCKHFDFFNARVERVLFDAKVERVLGEGRVA